MEDNPLEITFRLPSCYKIYRNFGIVGTVLLVLTLIGCIKVIQILGPLIGSEAGSSKIIGEYQVAAIIVIFGAVLLCGIAIELINFLFKYMNRYEFEVIGVSKSDEELCEVYLNDKSLVMIDENSTAYFFVQWAELKYYNEYTDCMEIMELWQKVRKGWMK